MKTEDIERYINHEMDDAERSSFELEMKYDPELRKDVDEMQVVIQQLKLAALSAKIKGAQEENKRASQIKTYSIIAVICLGLLSFLYYIFLKSENPVALPIRQEQKSTDTVQINMLPKSDTLSPANKIIDKKSEQQNRKTEVPIAKSESNPDNRKSKELAMNAYFVPKEFEYVRGENVESVIDSARLAFNNEQYSNALKYLNRISKPSGRLDYFKAHIYFNMGQYNQAGKLFERMLLTEKSPDKREEIEWYLLLNNLGCGSKCKAGSNRLFIRISQNPEHAYYKQAINLKKKFELE